MSSRRDAILDDFVPKVSKLTLDHRFDLMWEENKKLAAGAIPRIAEDLT